MWYYQFMKEIKPIYEKQTAKEEIANSIIHGITALLAVAGTVLLVVCSARQGNAPAVTAYSIYGASLILLFTMSTLAHSLTPVRAKNVFEILDHAFVFVLIAGTYTPIALLFVKGAAGWSLFGIAWGLAACGIVFKAFFTGKLEAIALIFYVVMGWLVVIGIPAIKNNAPGFLFWLVSGGVVYTAGAVFFAIKKIPWHHIIWHVFVSVGAALHFFGFLFHGIKL